jgi:hypothetical protein
MPTFKRRTVLLLAAVALVFTFRGVAPAQDDSQGGARTQAAPNSKQDQTNHEVQLFLLSASNGAGQPNNVPKTLEGVVRQLNASLPFADYRLAATFINRVKDGGALEVRGVSGAPFTAPSPNTLTPTFYNFRLGGVKLGEDASGLKFVQIPNFNFGLKYPVQTATTRDDKGQSFPVIQYEDTGITTQMSVREGEPTVVGTITTGRPEEIFVLVVTIKRTSR